MNDLEMALHDIGYWLNDLRLFEGNTRDKMNRSNINLFRAEIRKVLAARVVVFDLFLQLAIALDGSLRPEHQRLWLMFQLSNRLPQLKTMHPFVRMMRCLDCASDRALSTLFYRLEDIHSRHFPSSRIIFALDEAQQAMRLYRHSFLSSSNPTKFRSILPQIVRVFLRLSVKVVVSGTWLSYEEVEDPQGFGVGKPPGQFRIFNNLGMFDTRLKLEATLRRYIPPSFLESDSGKHLLQRIWEYLPGR